MSKFFFKGRPDVMGDYSKSGYSPKPKIKLGSATKPLSLVVKDERRKLEVEQIVKENDLVAEIHVDLTVEENIADLTTVLNKPTTQRFEKVPARNEPCFCGSGKKYKKCCG